MSIYDDDDVAVVVMGLSMELSILSFSEDNVILDTLVHVELPSFHSVGWGVEVEIIIKIICLSR